MVRLAAILAMSALSLQGCAGLMRLGEVGSPPSMSSITDPTKDPKWRPVSMPMPAPEASDTTANSLWHPGSRAFFKDQRAAQIGDIVTVIVNIVDSATVKNGTTATRTGSQALGAPDVFGIQSAISKALGHGADLTKLLSTDSASSAAGTGSITRGETIQIRVGGVITQVFPNGNLAVAGRQEVRVNSELRELQLSGVIRPQDIQSDNTVLHDRMAEARISYGGRGQLTDVQTPHWGQSVFDIVSPF